MNRHQRRMAAKRVGRVNGPQMQLPSAFEAAASGFQTGRILQAETACRALLAEGTHDARVFYSLGIMARACDRSEIAAELISRAISLNPEHIEAYSVLSSILVSLGRGGEALQICEKAIAVRPDSSEPYGYLGRTQQALGRTAEAIEAYKNALTLDQGCVDAYYGLGTVYNKVGQIESACDAFREVIRIKPDFVDAHRSLATILRDLGQLEEAEACLRHSLSINPKEPAYYADLAIVLLKQGRQEEAVIACREALSIKPDDAATLTNLGNALHDLKRSEEAVRAYEFAIKVDPKLSIAVANLATVYRGLGRLEESIEAYRRARALDPNSLKILAGMCHQRRFTCDWDGLEADEAKVLSMHRGGNREPVPTFQLLTIPGMTQADLLEGTRAFSERYAVPEDQKFKHCHRNRERKTSDRIRVGYLSADYYNHATSFLIPELLEKHDRSRFDIIGYSMSPDDGSSVRQRIINAFDDFVDIGPASHAEAARKIFDDKIDILIDLKGHTHGARTEILAYRPAPIQVNYLGYPGTIGVNFVDYIIGDPIITPFACQAYFTENIVQLPHCYQPNDTKRIVSQKVPTRAECNLPEGAFVFCCFNNNYKLTVDVFDIWMRLLAAVPSSVLWLLDANQGVRGNLRREAAARGIDPHRLVFAANLPVPVHLARQVHADLFLDTLPVNAHTTASDALWAGLPVVTCLGETFAGRVAASLLNAIGMSELVTSSLREYEELALTLATNPAKLVSIRQKLAQNKLTTPLFDIDTYTHNLERAFIHMVDLQRSGTQPRAFAVAELPAV